MFIPILYNNIYITYMYTKLNNPKTISVRFYIDVKKFLEKLSSK